VANTEVERHTGVDVEDVPSAEWGWSKENHKLIHIGGLLAAGFMLERLIEPRPTPGLRELDETAYNKLHQAPCFLAVRLLRP